MSINLLRNPKHRHGIADDLESFIWLLVWIAARYGPHLLSAPELLAFLTPFDYNPQLVLHAGKVTIARQGSALIYDLSVETQGFESLLITLMKTLHELYLKPEALSVTGLSESQIDQVKTRLHSHDWMMQTIGTALENIEWRKTVDPYKKHILPIPPRSTQRAARFIIISLLTTSWNSAGSASKRAHEEEGAGSSSSKKQRTSSELGGAA
jgi:hypothetical protein